MPVAYLDLPSGVPTDAKQTLLREVATFLHDAYLIPDNRVLIREWPPEQISIDGNLARPLRPICTFVVPPGLPVEAKQDLVKRVSSAIAEACNLPREDVRLPSGTQVSTRWVLGFFSEYPLEQAALDDLMAFENPMVLESGEAAIQASPSRRR
jgi:phenylpyruvate tautomerase PptA (4-oxalocrotonate tautomerase family)